jgi:hypothetical protein
MAEIRELAETLAAFSGASGVGLAPAAREAVSAFWRRDVTRNAMREVEGELLRVRPAPGDAHSMREIARQLRLQLVDPAFLAAVEDVSSTVASPACGSSRRISPSSYRSRRGRIDACARARGR